MYSLYFKYNKVDFSLAYPQKVSFSSRSSVMKPKSRA